MNSKSRCAVYPQYRRGGRTLSCRGKKYGRKKKNLIYSYISSLMERNIKVLIMDLKQNYRHMLRRFCDRVTKVGTGDFRYNPLEVHPGVDPRKAAQTKANTISHAFGLLTGSEGYLYQAIDDLYREFSVYSGKNRFPTMADLHEYLLSKQSKSTRSQHVIGIA